MTPTPERPPDPVVEEWPIFLSYRSDDGGEIALWLWKKLHGQQLEQGRAGPRLSVYLDRAAKARGDWSETFLPYLEAARAFIFISTPGSYSRLPGVDWVHRELEWWLKNRPNAEPIVVETTAQAERWVPEKIARRWPKTQRARILANWSEEDLASHEATILAQILGAIRPSERKAFFQDRQRLERANSRLRLTVASLSAVAMALFVAIGIAWQLYLKAGESAEAAKASKKDADEKKAVALAEKAKAEQRSRVLQARQLAAEALNTLPVYPQRALLLAAEAVRATRDCCEPVEPAAETALRDVLGAVEGSVRVASDSLIAELEIGADGRRVVTNDPNGSGLVLHEADGRPVILPTSGYAGFLTDPSGRHVVAHTFNFDLSEFGIISSDYGFRLRCWDLDQPRRPPVELPGGSMMQRDLQFHPDGRRVLALDPGENGAFPFKTTLKAWDLEHPEAEPVTLRGHEGKGDFLLLSRNGRFAVSNGQRPVSAPKYGIEGEYCDMLWVWDLDRPGDEPIAFAARPITPGLGNVVHDGHRIAVVFNDRIKIWEHSKIREQPAEIPIPKDTANLVRMAWLADGRLVGNWKTAASSPQDGPSSSWLQVWDPKEPHLPSILRLPPVKFDIQSLVTIPGGSFAFLPDKEVGSTPHAPLIYLWNPDRQDDPPVILRGHEGEIKRMRATPDGKVLLTLGSDRTVRRWDLERPSTEPMTLRGHASRAARMDDEPLGLPWEGWKSVVASSLSPNDQDFATVDVSGVTRTWALGESRVRTVHPARKPPDLKTNIRSIALSHRPDGKSLDVADSLGVRRLDVDHPDEKPAEILSFPGPAEKLEIGPGGRFLVAAGNDIHRPNREATTPEFHPWFQLWDLERPAAPPVPLLGASETAPLLGASETAEVFAFHPDGNRLSAVVANPYVPIETPHKYSIRTWDLHEPQHAPDDIARDVGYGITRIGVAPGSRWLLVAYFLPGPESNLARIWDLRQLERPSVNLFSKGHLSSFVFHADDRRLFFSTDKGGVFAVDLSEAEPKARQAYRMPDGAGAALQVHPDGRRFAVGAPDGTIYLGDLERPEAQPVALSGHSSVVANLVFHPDGKRLLSIGTDGTVRIWTLDVDDLLDLVARRAGRNLRKEEWDRSLQGQPYRQTFDHLPAPVR